MTGLRRTWLLWRASRYRKRAGLAIAQADANAREWSRIADELEREAHRLRERS